MASIIVPNPNIPQQQPTFNPPTPQQQPFLTAQIPVTCPARQQEITFNPIPQTLPPPPSTRRSSSQASFKSNNKDSATAHQKTSTTPRASLPIPPTATSADIKIPTAIKSISADQQLLALMSFDHTSEMGVEPVDWDQFLVDADLGAKARPPAMSPLPSDSHTSSPKSTESEQSQALDPSEPSPELAFTHFGLSTGIMHRSEDMYDALPSYFPDEHCTSDPTMTETFGMKYGDFGDITGLGDNAASQLGLTNLFDKLSAPAVAQHASADVDLQSVYAALGWTLPTAVEPQLISPPTPLKRKASDSSDESALAKRPRGRPPKPRPDAKRPSRRQSKAGSSVPALVAAAVLDTPTSRSVTFADIDGSDHESVVAVGKKAGKSSTARPKSVVPEKYLKDGSAQTMLGMSVDQIQSFPTFEELLKMVSSSLRPGAAEFGERIKENRDKAKDAAKKSRDERRAKIDSLEKTVAELEGTIEGMRGVLATLVTKGLLDQGEMAVWL